MVATGKTRLAVSTVASLALVLGAAAICNKYAQRLPQQAYARKASSLLLQKYVPKKIQRLNCGCVGANLLSPDPHVSGIALVPDGCVVPSPYLGIAPSEKARFADAKKAGLCYRKEIEQGRQEGHDPKKEKCLRIDDEIQWLKRGDTFSVADEIFPCDDRAPRRLRGSGVHP